MTDLEIFFIVGRPPVQAVDVVTDETAGRLPSVGHVVDSRSSHAGCVVSVRKRVYISIGIM